MSQKLTEMFGFKADFAVFKTPFSNFSGQNLKLCLDSSNFMFSLAYILFKIGLQKVGSYFLIFALGQLSQERPAR